MKLSEALKTAQAPPPASAEKFNVYLACGILPLHLTTFLTAHLRQRLPDRAIEIHTGLYGDLPGNLLQLSNSSAHAGAVVIEWSDLDPRLGRRQLGGWGPSVLPDVQANVQLSLNRLLQLLGSARSIPLALCLPTIPLPPFSNKPGEQFSSESLLLEKNLYDFAASASEFSSVRIVSRQRLDSMSPLAERLDVKSELSTGFPYRTAHASHVAELLACLIQPRPPKKGLITDLDDTLWRGLLGEEGVDGVSWELDQRSHIHALYQQLLAALSESGVLLGVASKNDPALVAEAMRRQDFLLPPDRLFPIEVNWNAKSQSVGRIIETWNINPDAVVFVDDSPLELAEVKSRYPAIECLRFPADDEQAAYLMLENLRDLFAKQEILEEDIIRVNSLRGRQQLRQDSTDVFGQVAEDFIGKLEAELTLSPVSPGDGRAFELVNKTNQFNLNGRRFNEREFQSALNRSGAVSLLVSYKDKYGPLGRIAVLLGQRDAARLKIDSWVMSCRAFSRHIEFRSLEYLFESLGVSEIEFDYQTTERNGPLKDFLSKLIDTEPTSPVRIQRETFMSRKPELTQKINEVSHA